MCWVAFSEAGDVLSPLCCGGLADVDGHPLSLEDIAQQGVKRPQPIACGSSSANTEPRGQSVDQLTRPVAEDGRTQLSTVAAAERPTGQDVAATLCHRFTRGCGRWDQTRQSGLKISLASS